MDRPERRRHKRLEVRYEVSSRKIGAASDMTWRGHTTNVSSGGACIETMANEFSPGDFLHVELIVPPTVGVLEFGGRIKGYAKVLRSTGIGHRLSASEAKFDVAFQFCSRLQLCL